MKSVRDRLFDLYAQGRVETVHQSAEYQKLFDQYSGDERAKRDFFEERDRFERMREQIDQWINEIKPDREQVEMALRLVWRLRGADSQLRGDYAKMILESHGREWDPQYAEYFEKWAEFLVSARPYFLSFTTRNQTRDRPNPLNRNHKFFILDALGEECYEKADLSTQNLVAETVYYHLQHHRPGGFYYRLHEGNNQIVETKLRDALGQSLALVQLVQGEIFRPHAQQERRNWCHFEHQFVHGVDPERILFVQIEPAIDRDEVFIDFEPWYQHFATKDPIRLEWTRWGSEVENVDGNLDKISRQLIEQIDRARDLVYLGIP